MIMKQEDKLAQDEDLTSEEEIKNIKSSIETGIKDIKGLISNYFKEVCNSSFVSEEKDDRLEESGLLTNFQEMEIEEKNEENEGENEEISSFFFVIYL